MSLANTTIVKKTIEEGQYEEIWHLHPMINKNSASTFTRSFIFIVNVQLSYRSYT